MQSSQAAMGFEVAKDAFNDRSTFSTQSLGFGRLHSATMRVQQFFPLETLDRTPGRGILAARRGSGTGLAMNRRTSELRLHQHSTIAAFHHMAISRFQFVPFGAN